ncbi:hypothetical protein IFM89_024692 [Coptis chinensis]|uniref:Uncharacterized protein n=1 Tax=Coptis chinensis TaxID=261450 RepID=A0A835IXN0_9MAGN|nr:hypothetical protein IFM89_024692 [Coptis chinensis]
MVFNISNKTSSLGSSTSTFLHNGFSLQSLKFPSFVLKTPSTTAGIAFARVATEKSIHDFTVKDIDGKDVSLK